MIIENYNYYLENFIEREPRNRIMNTIIPGNSLGQRYNVRFRHRNRKHLRRCDGGCSIRPGGG